MSWGKVSDTINDATEFAKAAEIGALRLDPRLEAELKGWTLTLFMWSAAQKTDYMVPRSVAAKLMGMQMDRVLSDLKKIGVIIGEKEIDGELNFELVDKEQTLIHLVKTSEKKMEVKRKRDRNDSKLVVPVLLRDGSTCRYCGSDVNWDDHRHADGGTFDHREPDKKTTVENLVVCCRSCNRLRADEEHPDVEYPLCDPPEEPLYDGKLRKKLLRWPNKVSAVARELGIPNPLGTVEPQHHSRQDDTSGAVESTMNVGPSQGPSARPAEVSDPRTDRQQPAAGDRTANAPGPLSSDSSAASEGGASRGRRRGKRRRHR